MHFDKKDIEIYLQGVWAAIDAEKYQFAPRHKNRELLTDYVISEEIELDIIKSLTPMDFPLPYQMIIKAWNMRYYIFSVKT